MSRVLFISIGLMLLLGACTQRLICPAYQSSFIHDQETLRKKFSYFENDSIPKVFTASTKKNQYLVATSESYRKKMRSLQTVEMKPIYPQIPDSLKSDQDSTELLAEGNIIPDSTAQQPKEGLDPGDSAYAITKTKEKYNVEQDNYMWYFRDVLVLPDVRAAMEAGKESKRAAAGKSEKKKGVFGFFKNMFKKKSTDSTAVSAPAFDEGTSATFVDSTAAVKPKKGGLFKKKEKKPKPEKVKKPEKDKKKEEPKDPKKKEEEEDGF